MRFIVKNFVIWRKSKSEFHSKIYKAQTMGRDPNVGRQVYADGSRRLVNYRTCKENDLRTQDFKSKDPSYEITAILRRNSRNQNQIRGEDFFFRDD